VHVHAASLLGAGVGWVAQHNAIGIANAPAVWQITRAREMPTMRMRSLCIRQTHPTLRRGHCGPSPFRDRRFEPLHDLAVSLVAMARRETLAYDNTFWS